MSALGAGIGGLSPKGGRTKRERKMWIPLKKYHFRPVYPHWRPENAGDLATFGGFSAESNV
jgi:hypothetical protein